jgi:hypothetical protein
VVCRIFQSFVGGFKQQTLLGVCGVGFVRSEAKKSGVKFRNVVG